MLVQACGEEPRSSDDDDGDLTETTTGGTTVSGAQSGSGGATTTGSGGSGGATSTTSGSGGSTSIGVGDLIISEIMNNPAAVTDAEGEWFEIHNVTAQPIDLGGLLIRHTSDPAAALTIDSPVIVPPFGYAVLARNGDSNSNGGVPVDYVYSSAVSLTNTADYLAIVRSDNTIIDETNWDELSGLDPDGASRNLDPQAMVAAMNDDDTNFCEASTVMPNGDLGTPGSGNDACP
jgi:hypothetical protein